MALSWLQVDPKLSQVRVKLTQLAAKLASSWHQSGTKVCQIDPRLSDYSRSFQGTECLKGSLQESLDLAITLSLSSTLNDHEQHALWLAKLLLNERSQTNVSWTIISYQNGEGQNQKEIEHASKLLDLAKAMGLKLKEVIIISPDDQWSISAYEGVE